MSSDFGKAYQALFSKIAPETTEGGPYWSPTVSPLFPTRWPATKGTSVLRYAYAHGDEDGLDDGILIAAPWAIVIVSSDGQNRELTPVGPFMDLGTQGVWPLEDDEADLPTPEDLEDEFRSLVMAGLPKRPPTHIRGAYQRWRECNSIAHFLKPLQPGFFAWLDQD
jgi:hypothetical protein